MKLLASDFDNTLWFNDHMKDNDVKNIKEFQKHGNLFGVCRKMFTWNCQSKSTL